MNTPPRRQNAVSSVCWRRRFFFLHITSSSEKETPKHIPGPFSGKKGRSIIGQDKGPHRFAARPGHFAPQCGAFSENGTAPYFGGKEKIRTGWRAENT